MTPERSEFQVTDPNAGLERALIEEFLAKRGHTTASVQALPIEEMEQLLKEACLYASGRITEVESRAHYVDEMHHGRRE
jgi:hypothetical protein